MRDLSQLYAFEKLLDEANNELVRAGVVRGLHPIGSVCSLAPEPLLNLPGCFSVRLRRREQDRLILVHIICQACCASVVAQF